MTAFRVGQRVRIVRPNNANTGKEATITCIRRNELLNTGKKGVVRPAIHYRVRLLDSGREHGRNGLRLAYEQHDLVPLTDPGCDAMLRRILKPLPLNLTNPEGVTQ